MSRARERRREGSWEKRVRGESGGMSVVGWLVIDAGDKEAVARVKFRAGSGPVSSIASACHRCSRSECNKMLPIVFRRSVVFYCLCCCLCFFFCCCSLFSLLFRLFCFFFALPIANFVASQSPQSRLRIEAQHQLRALHGSCTYGWDSLYRGRGRGRGLVSGLLCGLGVVWGVGFGGCCETLELCA